MTQRRDFIKKALIGGLGLGLLPSFKLYEEPPAVGWNDINSQFNIPEDYYYFNTGTLGISPKYVIHHYQRAIEEINTKGHYDQYKKKVYSKLASFLSCSEEELAITRNVTEGNNIAAWALPLKKGDEVILTTHEHAGNAIPWLNRARIDGLKIVLVELGKDGNDTLSKLSQKVSARTKVIAMPHIPCSIGHILPVKQIVKLARTIGAYSCIDGAHGAGMLSLNLPALGCDIYAGCFHKWMLGPKGSGFVYVKKSLLPTLETYFAGAYSDQSWSFEKAQPSFGGIRSDSAQRHSYGTQSDPLFAGIAASIEYMEALGMKKVENTIRNKGKRLCEQLLEMPEIELLVSEQAKENAGIISFRPRKKDYRAMTESLGKEGFRLRTVSESGINCIRVSTHIYNRDQDIDRLAGAIKKQLG